MSIIRYVVPNPDVQVHTPLKGSLVKNQERGMRIELSVIHLDMEYVGKGTFYLYSETTRKTLATVSYAWYRHCVAVFKPLKEGAVPRYFGSPEEIINKGERVSHISITHTDGGAGVRDYELAHLLQSVAEWCLKKECQGWVDLKAQLWRPDLQIGGIRQEPFYRHLAGIPMWMNRIKASPLLHAPEAFLSHHAQILKEAREVALSEEVRSLPLWQRKNREGQGAIQTGRHQVAQLLGDVIDTEERLRHRESGNCCARLENRLVRRGGCEEGNCFLIGVVVVIFLCLGALILGRRSALNSMCHLLGQEADHVPECASPLIAVLPMASHY